MRADIKRLNLERDIRMIAISDIHGNLAYLKGVLDKAGFGAQDCLVLVGDYIEKGPESLNTLRYIMELARKYHVEVLCGNCEAFVMEIMKNQGEKDRIYLKYLQKRQGIIKEMCLEQGISLDDHTDLDFVRDRLFQAYKEELDFIDTRPVILETEHCVFVHASLQSDDLENQDRYRCMKCDHFMEQGHIFAKYCVVGHWPVVLYHRERPIANPVIDREHRVVSIDGGCVLKDDGQLNALLISDHGREDMEISWVYYDDYPKAVVREKQSAVECVSFNIPWIDNGVEVLERSGDFSYCRHRTSGYCMWILNRYLYEEENGVIANDCTDYILPVEAGDVVSVIEETSRGYLIKKDGCSGWYMGSLTYCSKVE